MLDDLSTGFADTIPAGVEFHQLPVHQIGRVLTPDAGFDGVLHFAGRIEVAESVARPDLYWNVNVAGTMAVLDRDPRGGHAADDLLLDRVDVRRGGVCRSDGGFSKLAEDAVVRPRNPYAATKLAVDLMLAGECEAFGLGAASLRYFNAAGAVGPRSASGTTRKSHLIPIVLQVAGGQRERADAVRRRLPDARRHLRPRLHPRRRPGRRAPARPGRDHSRAGTRSTTSATATATASSRSSRRSARSPATRSPSSWPRAAPATPAATVASSDKARRELGWQPGPPRPARHHRRRLGLPPGELVTTPRPRRAGRARPGGRAGPPVRAWPAARRG